MLSFITMTESFISQDTVILTLMFTISCYSFHPLLRHCAGVWRFSRCVSESLIFIITLPLVLLCSGCRSNAMPLSTSSDENSRPEAYRIISESQIDPGRASGEPLKSQHVVLDFQPNHHDTRESEEKCEQFWKFVNSQPELEGMMVKPTRHEEIALEDVLVNKESKSQRRSKVSKDNNYPAVHTLKKMSEKHVVNTAFHTAVPPRTR